MRAMGVDGRGPGGRVTALAIAGDHGGVTVYHELPVRRLFANKRSII